MPNDIDKYISNCILANNEENVTVVVFMSVCPLAVGIMEESQEQMLRDY